MKRKITFLVFFLTLGFFTLNIFAAGNIQAINLEDVEGFNNLINMRKGVLEKEGGFIKNYESQNSLEGDLRVLKDTVSLERNEKILFIQEVLRNEGYNTMLGISDGSYYLLIGRGKDVVLFNGSEAKLYSSVEDAFISEFQNYEKNKIIYIAPWYRGGGKYYMGFAYRLNLDTKDLKKQVFSSEKLEREEKVFFPIEKKTTTLNKKDPSYPSYRPITYKKEIEELTKKHASSFNALVNGFYVNYSKNDLGLLTEEGFLKCIYDNINIYIRNDLKLKYGFSNRKDQLETLERGGTQCYGVAILTSKILEKNGFNAGVSLVGLVNYKGEKFSNTDFGKTSGHALTLIKLGDRYSYTDYTPTLMREKPIYFRDIYEALYEAQRDDVYKDPIKSYNITNLPYKTTEILDYFTVENKDIIRPYYN